MTQFSLPWELYGASKLAALPHALIKLQHNSNFLPSVDTDIHDIWSLVISLDLLFALRLGKSLPVYRTTTTLWFSASHIIFFKHHVFLLPQRRRRRHWRYWRPQWRLTLSATNHSTLQHRKSITQQHSQRRGCRKLSSDRSISWAPTERVPPVHLPTLQPQVKIFPLPKQQGAETSHARLRNWTGTR